VRPTVLGDVTPAMTVAREEVFGPVLSIIAYDTVEQAVQIANDTPYGLSGYVWGADLDACRDVAARLRTGMVHLNGASLDSAAPFGGYKMSGREWGVYGLREFLEVKSVYGGAAWAGMAVANLADEVRAIVPEARPSAGSAATGRGRAWLIVLAAKSPISAAASSGIIRPRLAVVSK
jgi:delta 1-pyrroline-5-carboxylate dehydrogenase